MTKPIDTSEPPRQTTSPLTEYQAHLARGELAFQIDQDGKAVFYPRLTAPLGFRGPLRWQVSQGLGTVYATTWISPRGEASYNIALVDLDEGFRLMSRVESTPADQVCIGQRVRVRIQPGTGDEDAYPVFDPVIDPVLAPEVTA
jgi:uncharacterized OB-fold protein